MTDGEHVRDEHHLVVGYALGDEMVALDDVDAPGFVLVGDGVVARRAPVAVLLDERLADHDGLARRAGALGHETANEKAHASIFESEARFVFEVAVKARAAAVRADDEADFVGESLVEGGALARLQHVRPIRGEGFARLRDGGSTGFGRHRFARGVVPGRAVELLMQRAAARIFVVADDDAAGLGNVFPDNNGGAHGSKGSFALWCWPKGSGAP